MRSVVAVLTVMLLVSCTENNPPAQQKPMSILSPPVSAQAPGAKSAVAPAKPTARAEQSRRDRAASKSSPALPKGAQYTIFCQRIEGPAHVERANRLKHELIDRTQMEGWHVVHENGQSLLYYGYYRTFNDPNDRREAARAQGDLKRIKGLTSEGNSLFAGAMFVDLEAPDPVAPPEWNLVNANGVWSLQIAAYKDSPLRKEAAVDAVREARKQGIDAYYYHGDTVSSVCIGVWPEDAVRMTAPRSAGTYNPLIVNQPVITSAEDQSPDTTVTQMQRDAKKVNAEVVQEKVEIVDPSLVRAMQQYPHHAVNGMHMTRKVNGQDVVDPSLVIRIPEPEQSDSTLSAGAEDYQQLAPMHNAQQRQAQPLERFDPPAPAPAQKRQPPPPPPAGMGKLKSVDG